MKPLTRYILSRFGGRVATRNEVKAVCDKFGSSYTHTTNFMISYGYFVRILRGLYYVKTLDEFKLGKLVDPYRIIPLGMERLDINWYSGLHTALRLNGLTHEFFTTIFVMNGRIYRPKEIAIAGERVRFLKLKDRFFGFGVRVRNGIRFSDPEKTVLDLVHIYRYRGMSEERTISMVGDYSRDLDREKVGAYLDFYPKTVERVVRDAGLV